MPELAEVETQKTAGFVDRGYNHEKRKLRMEEEAKEIAELEAQQRGESEEPEEAEEATESSPMEAAFVEEINSLMFNLEEESPTLEVTPSEPLSQTERLEETNTNLEESIDLETFFTSETTVEEQEEE